MTYPFEIPDVDPSQEELDEIETTVNVVDKDDDDRVVAEDQTPEADLS